MITCWRFWLRFSHLPMMVSDSPALFPHMDTSAGIETGESETIIGKWLKRSQKRQQVIIATKVGAEMGPGKKGLSKSYILAAVEDSLQRLQTDYTIYTNPTWMIQTRRSMKRSRPTHSSSSRERPARSVPRTTPPRDSQKRADQ